jgi:multidrug efflux pump subunit AcrA (membrane-fusion protein)
MIHSISSISIRRWLHFGLPALLAVWVSFLSDSIPDASGGGQDSPNQSSESSQERPTSNVVVEAAILKTIESTAVASQVTGVMQNLNIKEGSRVRQGEEIARIRDVTVRLQLQRAETAVEMAKRKQNSDIDQQIAQKNQGVATNEYQRALDANSRVDNVYPPNEMDRLKLILDRSILETQRAEYQQQIASLETALAEVEVKQTQELLLRHRVMAPCAGMVVAVEKRVGEWLEPGTVIAKIVEIDRLRVEGFLNAADADPAYIGTKAVVRVEIAGQPLEVEGELVFISPDANPVSGQVRVFIEVENRDQKLRPGLRPMVYLKGQP